MSIAYARMGILICSTLSVRQRVRKSRSLEGSNVSFSSTSERGTLDQASIAELTLRRVFCGSAAKHLFLHGQHCFTFA